MQIVGVLRIYSGTQPGKRSRRFATHLLLPEEDLQLDLDGLAAQAKQRYRVRWG